MRRVAAAWERFWFAPEPTSTLAVYRIAIGAICFGWALTLLPDFYAFFSSRGVEPVPPFHPPLGVWGVLDTFPSFTVAVGLYAALLVASLCLTVGYRTRPATVVVFVAVLSFENRAPSIWSSGDNLLRILCFFLIFAPAGSSLSVDRWRIARDRFWEFPARAPWALRLVQIQVSVVYLSTFWYKIHGSDWRHGTAVSYAARLEDFQRFAMPGVLSHSLLFSTVMTYWTLAIELMLGILVWNRAARPFVLWLGVAMHFFISLTLRLGFFSETMVASYLAFLAPAAATAVILSARNRFAAIGARVREPRWTLAPRSPARRPQPQREEPGRVGLADRHVEAVGPRQGAGR